MPRAIKKGIQSLFYSAKYSFLLLTLFLVPVMVNVHYILNLWLTTVPPFCEIFVQLMLLQSLIHILFNPITTIVNATGNIKQYQIGTFIILISNIFFIYVVYEAGCAAYIGIIVQCIITFIQLLFSMFVMQKVTCINAMSFFRNVVLHVFCIFAICFIFSYGCKYYLMSIDWHPLISILASIIITTTVCFFIGISKNIKEKIITLLLKKIKK